MATSPPQPVGCLPPPRASFFAPYGRRHQGFGTGYWNGFGGKVEPGESVEAAAQRELQEEAGITALDLAPCGRLFFVFDDKPDTPWEVHGEACRGASCSA